MTNRGADIERELVNHLRRRGTPALRIPSSGSSTERELPDVLIRADGHILAAELKYTTTDTAVLHPDELAELQTFAKRWDAVPIAVARYSYDTTFHVVPLLGPMFDELVTDSGYLRLSRSGTTAYHELDEYLDIVRNTTGK